MNSGKGAADSRCSQRVPVHICRVGGLVGGVVAAVGCSCSRQIEGRGRPGGHGCGQPNF
jgi:hypothetical protein